jgi:hypothetical protein
VPPNTTGNRFAVAITDGRGRRAELGSVTVDGLPAGEYIAARWAQEVRVPLPRRGIDLRNITALELAGGEGWLVDANGRRGGLPAVRPVDLPRIDVGEVRVDEGDAGTRHYEVPVVVEGGGQGKLRLFVGQEDGTFTTRLVDVRPGRQTIELPYDVTGDELWGPSVTQSVYAKALRGAVGGGYVGGLRVLDDDPKPTITVARESAVAEGGTLTWSVTLSAPIEKPLYWPVYPIPPEQEPALSTTDVDPEWFRANTVAEDPLPSRPLTETTLVLSVDIPAGAVTGTLSVPTVVDDEAEPAEHLRLIMVNWEIEHDAEVVGTVTG